MIKIKSSNKDEIMAQLRRYSLDEIFDSLAEYIVRDNAGTQKVILTPEQFNAFFKVRGLRIDDISQLIEPDAYECREAVRSSDGGVIRQERRGRPRKAVDVSEPDSELPM